MQFKSHILVLYCREFNLKFPTWEKQKIEKTHAKEKKKQSHAQENIYVPRQFAYVHGVAEISLLSGNNTKCGYSSSLSQKRQQQTLITKLRFLRPPGPPGDLSMSTPAWAQKIPH